MTDSKIKLVIASLLHDVGKVLYRAGENKNHSDSGYEFLKNTAGITEKDILDSVRYHHGKALSTAKIDDDSVAYITYIADNIASAVDRRKASDGTAGFARTAPLESVFNLLNNNNQKKYYLPRTLEKDINYPQEEKREFDSSFYKKVREDLLDCLKGIDYTKQEYINSLLLVTEALWTYVPSSTSTEEVADISLFDHSKLTSAYASVIYDYLQDKNITDYKTALFKNAKDFYKEKAFLMYSIDISGIQSFIYTIHTEKALKTLRARSFYLEIFMEAILDELLNRLQLSRANIIYNGGGHCYLLLANTERTKAEIEKFESEVNHWLLDNFKNSLYIAGGYAECSSENLQNIPEGSYSDIFSSMGKIISAKKMSRYSTDDILKLNHFDNSKGLRECKICRSLDKVDENNRCSFCNELIKIADKIMDIDSQDAKRNPTFFTVMDSRDGNTGLKLPFNRYLVVDSRESLTEKMKNNSYYVNSYCKNSEYTGYDIATNILVGSYHSDDQTDKLAKKSNNGEGIERIAVLRLDVDNLGYAFVHGFEREQEGYRYVTLSRTATLSRQLSLYFKKHINQILENPQFHLDNKSERRNALVVYAGGDDVFVIGAWDDVVGFAIDLKNNLKEFAEDTLTISGGIGIYDSSYPVSVSAKEVESLENASKSYCKVTNKDKSNPDKNAITIFDTSQTFSWDDFENNVINDKLKTLQKFFGGTKEYGKNFLYNLLNYLRNSGEKINLARYAYLLARMEPKTDDPQRKAEYKEFAEKMFKWNQDNEERRKLVTAIYLYAYLTRNKGKDDK